MKNQAQTTGKGRFLAAAALFAVSVSTAMAAPQVLSEDELGSVSAQGIQVISNPTSISAQQNNNDSVQLNGVSQQGAGGMQIVNNVNSAENIHTNLINLSGSSAMSMSQLNDQTALNDYEVSSQSITNLADASNQNNNNASVQINDNSQTGVNAGIVSNVSRSAKNIGQNIGNITNSTNIGLSQTNTQVATNSGSDYQEIYNGGPSTLQNNNNGSVQLNNNAQSGSNTMVLDNTASSAQNVAQNIMSVDGLINSSLSQTNTQIASNLKDIDQTITNDSTTSLQNNNNASVQLNDNTQTNSAGMIIKNTANSAQNVAQNIIDAQNMNGLNIMSQSNEQYASNGAADGETLSQVVLNQDVANQNNNHASVQLNGNSQAGTNSMVMQNTANSAANTAQNITSATGAVSVNIISSSNTQVASNYTRWDVDQSIATGDSNLQRNNTNSVQINDNTQSNTNGMVIANTAGSASNIGQNIGLSGQFVGFNVLLQSNEQYAYNGSGWSNWSFQDINNNNGLLTVTTFQDNNNASVQLNNGTTAQENVNSMVLANTAHSASNTAQNVAAAGNLLVGNLIAQSNYQEAYNQAWASQGIGNYGVINVNVAQDNNNSSVQISSGQNNVNSMAVLNVANSAANTAQNTLDGFSIIGLNLGYQSNEQYAANSISADQSINNNGLLVSANLFQDNNNSSVQVDNGQGNLNTMATANVASSANNIGQNIGNFTSLAQIAALGQYNTQTANSYASSYQPISNASLVLEASLFQDNNNGSVQINGAQNNNSSLAFTNAASSSQNIAQNVGNFTSLAQIAALGQYNTQTANNYAYSYQPVDNVSLVLEVDAAQHNNNASIQMNGAQNNNSSLALSNVASSASNIGQNILSIADIAGLDLAEQINNQESYSYSEGGQTVTNNGIFLASVSLAQDNNNASVQANNAQNNNSGMLLQNAAASATNIGQNIADVFNPIGFSYLNQENIQTATNEFYFDSHDITNDIAVAQNNNNGSVQLNNSQNGAASMMTLNTSLSAANSAMNIASITGSTPFGTMVSQYNEQTATNDIGAVDSSQTVSNGVVILGQNNNNGSVQLNSSQVGTTGMVILNAANSATNIGLNIANVSGASGMTITQTAIQSATNF